MVVTGSLSLPRQPLATFGENPELRIKDMPPAQWSACYAGGAPSEGEMLLTLAGVVLRIDEVELKWRLAMYLDNDLAAGHGVVMHVGVEKSKTAGSKRRHLLSVEVIAHTHLEGTF